MKLGVYTRPNKPRTIPVTKRRECLGNNAENIRAPTFPTPITVHASTECHVTPIAVAGRMAGYMGRVERMLEPSAGTGNLIVAAQTIRVENIIAVEKNYELCNGVFNRTGVKPICDDFLSYKPTDGLFDGVLMNPPFGRNQAKKHVEHAIDCMAPGGILIAIVPATFDVESFGGEIVEELPRDTFSTCMVSTKVIAIEK